VLHLGKNGAPSLAQTGFISSSANSDAMKVRPTLVLELEIAR
jgi:hypothetical protein